jgi:hypothetical protein
MYRGASLGVLAEAWLQRVRRRSVLDESVADKEIRVQDPSLTSRLVIAGRGLSWRLVRSGQISDDLPADTGSVMACSLMACSQMTGCKTLDAVNRVLLLVQVTRTHSSSSSSSSKINTKINTENNTTPTHQTCIAPVHADSG